MADLKKNNLYNKKFKKRYLIKNKKKINLVFGSSGVFFKKSIRLEFIYLVFFKKYIKLLRFLKLKSLKTSKFWFFLTKNYPISTKAKNARMGKGKGTILRLSTRLPSFFCFFEFTHFDYLKFKKFKKRLGYKFNCSLNLFIKQKSLSPFWIKSSKSYIFLAKYNLI